MNKLLSDVRGGLRRTWRVLAAEALLGAAVGGLLCGCAAQPALGQFRPEAQEPGAAWSEPRQKPSLAEVKRLIEAGQLVAAHRMLHSVLARDPENIEALDLFFRVVKTQVELLVGKDTPSSLRAGWDVVLDLHRERARAETALLRGDSLDGNAAQKLTSLQEEAQKVTDELTLKVLKEADGLYHRGKGTKWYNDDERKFIDALVLLDSCPIELVSPALRKEHAETWTKCHSELGSRDIETYKVRTALENGPHEDMHGLCTQAQPTPSPAQQAGSGSKATTVLAAVLMPSMLLVR